MADPTPPINQDLLDFWNNLRKQEQQGNPNPPPPVPAPSPLPGQVHQAAQPNPTVNMVQALLNQPSWLDRAKEESQRAGQAYQQGGPQAMLHMDPGPTQDLAGGFAGTFGGIRDPKFLATLKGAVAKGATPENLWNDYKVFQGLDSKFREYISDANMGIPPGFRDPVPFGYPGLTHATGVPLQHMVSHPELFSKFPELKGIPTDITKGKGYKGYFVPPEQPDPNLAKQMPNWEFYPGQITALGSTEKDLKDILAHEIQHGIQDTPLTQGTLAPGENRSALEQWFMQNALKKYGGRLDKMPAPVRNEAESKAWGTYQNSLGEIEARMAGSLAAHPPSEVNLDTLRSIVYNPTRLNTGRNVPWSWYQGQTPDVKDALRGSGVRAIKAYNE